MSDKLTHAQNSRYVSIKPDGASVYAPNQTVRFYLDESLGYIKGRETYLSFDLYNNTTHRWGLPKGAGANAIINRIDIYSRSTGQLLETLTNYNKWTCIENQYCHDDFSNMALHEGVGDEPSQYTNYYQARNNNTVIRYVRQLNPGDINDNLISPMHATNGTVQAQPRRFCIPLRAGLFRHWDDEKLIPILNMGGLRIDILLAPVEQVCKAFGALSTFDKLQENRIKKLNSTGVGIRINNIAGGSAPLTDVTTLQTNVNSYFTNVTDSGLWVGASVFLRGTVGGVVTDFPAVTVSAITTTATNGSIQITTTGDFINGNAGAITNANLYLSDTQNFNYELQNPEIKVVQMVVPKEQMNKLAKPMKYVFTSYDEHLDTLPTSSRRHEFNINSVASKAKALFCQFVDSATEEDICDMTYYSGLSPTESNLRSQILFMDNKLHPLHEINPYKENDKCLTLNELVKALRAINKSPLSLGSNKDGDLNDYTNTFLYARELARGDYVKDIRDSEPQIRFKFNNTRANNVRLHAFVFSKKIIDISPNGLMVEL
jgi:hypothetical protein